MVELPGAGIAAKRPSRCTLTVMNGWGQVVERPAGSGGWESVREEVARKWVVVGGADLFGPWAVARLLQRTGTGSTLPVWQPPVASPRSRRTPFKTKPVPCRDAPLLPPPHRADTMLNFKI
jgi:hypothetical protein